MFRLWKATVLMLGLLFAGPRVEAALIGHWRFDEGTGPVAQDSWGDHDGALGASGVSFISSGKAGGAVHFSGNGRIDLAATALTAVGNAGQGVSAALWLRPNSIVDYTSVFDTTSNRQLSLFLRTSTVNSARSFVAAGGGGGGSNLLGDVAHAWQIGQWQHVVFTYDITNSTISLYRNGVLMGTQGHASPDHFNKVWTLGYNASGGGNHYSGDLDDLQLYSGILTPEEIEFLAATPGRNLVPEPGTLALFGLGLTGLLCAAKRHRPVAVRERGHASQMS